MVIKESNEFLFFLVIVYMFAVIEIISIRNTELV